MKRAVPAVALAVVAMAIANACGSGIPTATAPTSADPSDPAASLSAPSPTATSTADGLAGVLVTSMHDPTQGLEVVVAIDLATGLRFKLPWYGPDTPLAKDLAWSPDGASLAMSHWVTVDSPDGSPTPLEGRVVIYDIDAAEPSIEFEGDARGPMWSPDGGAIAAQTTTEVGRERIGGTVAWWRDGREALRIPNSRPIEWVPGKPELVVYLQANRELALANLETGAVDPLAVFVDVAGRGPIQEPEVVWAPDGGSFAFVGGMDPAGQTAGCRICRFDLATRSISPIVPDAPLGSDVVPVAWPETGGLIVVTATDTTWALARVDAAGTLEVLDSADAVTRPMLSPDGTQLAYLEFGRASGDQELVVWSLADGTRTVVPDGGWRWAMLPIWRPAGGPLPWEPFEITEPETPTAPPSAAATIGLTSQGAIQIDTTFDHRCESAADGIRIEIMTGEPTVQLGLTPEGAVHFLSIGSSDFLAFAGKGFEVAPPWVIVDPGSTLAAGGLVFSDLPNALDDSRTIGGHLSWTCGL